MNSVELNGTVDVLLLKVVLVDSKLVGHFSAQVHCETEVITTNNLGTPP